MKRLLSSVLLVINVVFVVLFLVSTLAGYVRPSAVVWVSLLSYGYVPLLVVNIIFVLLWLFLSSKYFLVSLVAIVIRYSFIPLYYQIGGNDVVTDERNFTILTFNVHRFLADDACVNTIALVAENNPGVICFQEFVAKPAKVNIYDSLRRQGYSYNHSHVRKKKLPHGTAIFSKYPIIGGGVIGNTRNIYVDIKMPSDTVRIYNIHLSSYKLDEEDRDEIDRIKHGVVSEGSMKTLQKFKTTAVKHEVEIDKVVEHINESPYKTIVSGDFNDTPASYTYQRLREMYNDAYVGKGDGVSTTYNGMFPAFRIDYVLHDKAFATDSYRRIKVDISDHYPVLVSLKLH